MRFLQEAEAVLFHHYEEGDGIGSKTPALSSTFCGVQSLLFMHQRLISSFS